MGKRLKKDIAQQRAVLHETIEKSETLHEGNVLKESHALDELLMAYYKDKPEASDQPLEDKPRKTKLKASNTLPVTVEKD